MLAAETALTSDLAAREEVESGTAADRVAEIDAELREHAVATAKAAVVRDRRLPPVRQALDAVRAELYGSGSVEARNGSDPRQERIGPRQKPNRQIDQPG